MVSFPSILKSGALRLTDGSTTLDADVHRGKNGERRFSASTIPTQEGDPTTPFTMEFGFGYGGMGASDFPVKGMHDRSTMDARNLGYLYPRPLRTDISAAVSGAGRALFVDTSPDGTPYVYYGGASTLKKIQVSNDTVVQTISLTAGAVNSQAAILNGKWIIPMGSLAVFRVLTIANGAADTVAAGPANKYATAVAMGFSGTDTTKGFSLVRGCGTGGTETLGSISLCADESDTTVSGNWGAPYQILTPGQTVNSLVALGRFVYVQGPTGCYTTDEAGNGINLTPETANNFTPTNGLGGIGWHGGVLYPHRSGLYRISGEVTQSLGLEEIVTFDGTIRGRITAMTGYGKWLYLAVYDTASTWILCARERQNGEAGFGPLVFYSLEQLVNPIVESMCFWGGSDSLQPRLYFERSGVGISYYLLGRTGGPDRTDSALTYAPSGSHWCSANDNGNPNTLKTVTVAEYVAGGTLSASAYFQLQLSWDGSGSYTQMGANITATGWGQRFLTAGTNDTGRRPKLRIDYSSNSSTAPGRLEGGSVVLRGRERPLRAEVFTYELILNTGNHTPQQGLTAEGMWDQFTAWQEAGTVLTLTDKARTDTTKRVQVRDLSRAEYKSDAGDRPGHVVTVSLQVLEYA